jgi:hypothetical protein
MGDNQMKTNEQIKMEAADKLSTLMLSIADSVKSQLLYNITENIPRGIIKADEASDHAINSGLVSALGKHLQWDVYGAMELAADILEDVNAHSEAAKIRQSLKALQARLEVVS